MSQLEDLGSREWAYERKSSSMEEWLFKYLGDLCMKSPQNQNPFPHNIYSRTLPSGVIPSTLQRFPTPQIRIIRADTFLKQINT